MTPDRKATQDFILKHVDMLDPTHENYKKYKELFDKMSDKEFDSYMEAVKKGETQIYFQFPNLKVPMKIENILKAADALGTPITEQIYRYDPVTGRNYITPYEYLVLRIPVRRLAQYVKGKMNVGQSDTRVDSLTGQVVKPDRASSISQVETQILYAKGLKNSIRELIHVRGGNIKQYAQFKQQIEETGQASLDSLDPDAVSQSSITAGVILNGMMFEHNLVEGKGL